MVSVQEVKIGSPRRPVYDRDRAMDCRTALGGAFSALSEAAEQAGWEPDETALALLQLAGTKLRERAVHAAIKAQIVLPT